MIIRNINSYFQYSFKANFNKAEQQAIDMVRAYSQKYGVETAQIIKNGINITDKFQISEAPDAVMVSASNEVDKIFDLKGLSKIKAFINSVKSMINFKQDLQDSIYIHSHTTEMPLSPADIYTGVRFGIKKMVAVTPSGKTSVVEDLNINQTKAQSALSIFNSQIQAGVELREKFGEDYMQIPQAFKTIQKGQSEAIDEFAKTTGVKYSSDIEI